MSDQLLKVAVIGAGWGREVHIPGFQLTPETEVVALCDVDLGIANEVAKKYEIPRVVTDYHEVLNMQDIDIVTIATPLTYHYPMVVDAIDAGKHVLCEKPFTMNLDEAKKLYNLSKNSGLTTMLDHEWRYIPAWTKIKQLIDEEYIGDIRHISFTRFQGDARDPLEARPWNWEMDRSTGIGYLGAYQVHGIDGMRWWFGEFSGVYGQTENFIKERPDRNGKWHEVTTDNSHAFIFRMSNGALGTAFASVDVMFGGWGHMEVYGSKGTLVFDDDFHLRGARIGDSSLHEIPVISMPLTPKGSTRLLGPFMLLVNSMIKGIRDEESPSPNFFDGFKHMEVIEAIKRSEVERKWIDLPLEG